MSDEKVPEGLSELPDIDELPDLPDDLPEVSDEIPELPDDIPELPDDVTPHTTEAAEPAPAPPAAPEPPAPMVEELVPTTPPRPKPPARKSVPRSKPKADTRPEKAEPAEPKAEPAPAAAPSSGDAAPSAGAPAPSASEGERPPLRELDKAPLHLRKAAVVVCAGSLLPWMGHGGGWVSSLAGKALVLAGVWFWYQQVQHNWGPRLTGFLAKLGDLSFKKKPKEDEKKKTRRARSAQQQSPTALDHPFPTGLHLLSLLTIVAACIVLPLVDPREGTNSGIAMAELGMLAWAAYTWVHIHSYERWGKFNPIFPLMFLAMVIGGASRVVFGFDLGLNNFTGLSSVIGGAVVAVGGVLAAYTIVEALMQAKKEGDVKKQAKIAERKAAREARRSRS